MKKILIALAVLAFAGSAYAAQKSDATVKDVRNPQKLTAIINANAADAESRLTSGSTTASNLTLTGLADTATAEVMLQSDAPLGVADDAGDKYGIVASDGAGLLIQSDASSKGTLATKATIGADGLISSAVGLDAIGNVDFDIGSADMDDCTVTTDGGTVILDGSIVASDDITGVDFVAGGNLSVATNATVAGTLAVTGVGTFTAESVHNGGIDADYITTDAGYGIDNKSAGTLMVGASTATKVEIADSGVETEVQGALDAQNTLAVAGAATLASTLAVTGDTTLSADVAIASNLAVTGTAAITGASTLTGNATLNGTLTMLTNKFTVAATGNTSVGGTLAVTGAQTFTGNTTMNGTLTLQTNKFTVSAAGSGLFADDVTMDSVIFTDAATAAPTNSATHGFAVTVNGTNYWLALYPVND